MNSVHAQPLRGAVDAGRAAGPVSRVRDDIIAAATRVFSQRGYHAASMTEIADEVGIRKPSLYHHMRKKEDLLFAIHEQLIDELIEETTASLDAPDARRRRSGGCCGSTCRSSPATATASPSFCRSAARSAASGGTSWSSSATATSRWSVRHRGGDARRRVRRRPSQIAARALLAMANWGYTWFDPAGELSAEEVAEIFAEIALQGSAHALSTPPGRASCAARPCGPCRSRSWAARRRSGRSSGP